MPAAPTIVFTDGAAKGNPGPGGWGAVLLFADDRVLELGGGSARTTNNRMELTAAIEALELLAVRGSEDPVLVYTDSSYVVNGVTKWAAAWRRRGWKKTDGRTVLNRDLWERLADLAWARTRNGRLTWRRVAGHAGIAGNERADRIASDLALGRRADLYEGPVSGYPISAAELRSPPSPGDSDSAAPAGSSSKSPASDGAGRGEGGGAGTRGRGNPGSKRSRFRGRAYSYVSLVGGVARRHASWAECERYVKGRPHARFKKTRDAADERRILNDWGARIDD